MSTMPNKANMPTGYSWMFEPPLTYPEDVTAGNWTMPRTGVAAIGTFFGLVNLEKTLENFNKDKPDPANIAHRLRPNDMTDTMSTKVDPVQLILPQLNNTSRNSGQHQGQNQIIGTGLPASSKRKQIDNGKQPETSEHVSLDDSDTTESSMTRKDMDNVFDDIIAETINKFIRGPQYKHLITEIITKKLCNPSTHASRQNCT